MKTELPLKQELIDLRHRIHKDAEGGLAEFKTKAKILEFVAKHFPSKSKYTITEIGATGFVIELKGSKTVEASCSGSMENQPSRKIAIRAEIDALKMKEDNPGIDYSTTTDYAHMCGHDGHAVSLIGAFALIYHRIDRIPSNNSVKFIFQPAEETMKGAKIIIESGILKDVDQIFAIHNSCYETFGRIYLYPGYCMAASTSVDITIQVNNGAKIDPLLIACKINAEIEHCLETEFGVFNNKDFVFSLPRITASDDPLVTATKAELGGSLRYFDPQYKSMVLDKLNSLVTQTRNISPYIDISLKTTDSCSRGVYNDPGLAQTTKAILGNYDVSAGVYPSFTSDDFAFYSQSLKACYFGFDIGPQCGILHSSRYNFNDDAIEPIANIWLEIVTKLLE
jgi:amidohydrolase